MIDWRGIFGYLYDSGVRIHQVGKQILKDEYIEISIRAIQRYPKYRYIVIQKHWLKLKESKYSMGIMAFLLGGQND